MKVITEMCCAHFIRYLRFYNMFYHYVDTSAGGLLVIRGIIRPVVSVLALTWFIRYRGQLSGGLLSCSHMHQVYNI
jgi:hypothetical protein